MSTIPASAMPHAFAEEGIDLRDPHGGAVDEENTETSGTSTGVLIAGAAVVGYLLYRLIR